MKTKTYNVYKFNELSDKAKSKAIERYRYFNVEGINWWDFIYENQKEKLEKLGYREIEIKFSGFCSQGDGASFTASIDLAAYLKAHKLKTKYRLLWKYPQIVRLYSKRLSSHYFHENTCGTTWEYDEEIDGVDVSGEINGLASAIEEERGDLSRKIYKALEEEYFDLTSDEQVIEGLEGNDYDFTEDGRID